MKAYIFIPLFLLFSISTLFSQDDIPGVDVPEHVYKVPKKYKKDVALLTEFLVEPCETEREKVIAIFAWIADNIKYDIKSLVKKDLKPQSVNETISRKKGVCYHYTELFNTMCDYAGIKSYTVCGYAKGLGYQKGEPFIRANHAWNVVSINGEWMNIDMTWGSGFVWYYDASDEDKSDKASKKQKMYTKLKYFKHPDFGYFAIPSSVFVQTHFPWTSEFQLLYDPVDIDEYEKDQGLYISDEKIFDFKTKMDNNSNLTRRALEYKMGYDSHLYNPRNHFDKAVTIIIENYGLYANAEPQASDKNKYENVEAMFASAEDLLKKHKVVLSDVNKERKGQISELEKMGEKIPSNSKGLNPLKNTKSIKTLTTPISSQIKTINKAFKTNDEKATVYQEKLGTASRMDHSLNQYPEWSLLKLGMQSYESCLDSLDMLQEDKNKTMAVLVAEVDQLNQYLRVKYSEHLIIAKKKKCLVLIEDLKEYNQMQKALMKRAGIEKKVITTNQSALRQQLSSANLNIKKELRNDKDNASLQKKMNQNTSNYLSYYDNIDDVNNLKLRFNEGKIQRIKIDSDLYKVYSKILTKYETLLESHITFLEDIEEKNNKNEVELMEVWLERAKDEKKRMTKYVQQSQRAKRG